MEDIKVKAWSKQLNDFLDITAIEICKGEITGIFHDGDFIGYDKDDITIILSTGLKDKNGKEIYEGDILKGRKNYITVVFYKGMFSGKQHCVNYSEPLASWEMNCFEVIGNIYKNPELLEE